MRSRFFLVELEPYTYEQFLEITKQLLSHQKIEREVASAVWTKSQDIRDCVKIGSMAKTIEDVNFLVNMLRIASPHIATDNHSNYHTGVNFKPQ